MSCKCRLTAMALWLSALCLNAFAGSPGAGVDLQLSQAINISNSSKTGEQTQHERSEYHIDIGDRISVKVYQEPDLSIKDAKVSADGTIAFPLLGDLNVTGLSSRQLQKLVTERLADGYLVSPNVMVSIDPDRLYYIKGEVKSPGGYRYVNGLTVEKAVALAGGFSERASKQDITLVRELRPEQPLESVPPTTTILPGDVITIGESFF